MDRTVADAALIEAARSIAPLVRACRDEGERERRLPAQVLAAMHEGRLFRMYIPKALGGLEIDPITSMIVVEEIARADAAAAWNLMLGATYGLWAAFLPDDAAREIYGAPDAVVAGALRPTGRARRVDGGFVVDGRWSFASGIRHSAWWNAGCLVGRDGAGDAGDRSDVHRRGRRSDLHAQPARTLLPRHPYRDAARLDEPGQLRSQRPRAARPCPGPRAVPAIAPSAGVGDREEYSHLPCYKRPPCPADRRRAGDPGQFSRD